MKRIVNLLTASILLIIAFRIAPIPPSERFVSVTEKVMPSCVSITINVVRFMDDGTAYFGGVLGSGVFISKNGYILTCKHVVNFPNVVMCNVELSNGDVVAGKVVKLSDKFDLALIKVDYFDKVSYVKLADPRKLKVGREVVAIGSPEGLLFSVTSGIISALNRDFDKAYNVTQSDTAINPGNSGGPLFNLQGELVGINSFMLSALNTTPVFTGLGFSVQSGQCYEFLVECEKIYPNLKIKHFKAN